VITSNYIHAVLLREDKRRQLNQRIAVLFILGAFSKQTLIKASLSYPLDSRTFCGTLLLHNFSGWFMLCWKCCKWNNTYQIIE